MSDSATEPCSTTSGVSNSDKKSPKRKLSDTSDEPTSKKMRVESEENIEMLNLENSRYVLRVKKHSKEAKLPYRSSQFAAGYDLYASQDMTIPAKGKALVPTGISLHIPLGFYGRVAPRSGLALKHHLDVGAGVIDSDYRGEIGILLFNFSNEDFIVKIGNKVAQLLLEKIITPQVEEVSELDSTERGEGGFGSTGLSDGKTTEGNQKTD